MQHSCKLFFRPQCSMEVKKVFFNMYCHNLKILLLKYLLKYISNNFGSKNIIFEPKTNSFAKVCFNCSGCYFATRLLCSITNILFHTAVQFQYQPICFSYQKSSTTTNIYFTIVAIKKEIAFFPKISCYLHFSKCKKFCV